LTPTLREVKKRKETTKTQSIPMKKSIMFGALTLLAGSLMAADSGSKDEIKAAAKKLGDNYAWKSTVENAGGGGFGGGPTEGKTAGGTSWLSLTRRDTTIEAFLIGTNKGAIKVDGSWQSLSEASQDAGGGFNPTSWTARTLQAFKAPADQAVELAEQVQSLTKEGDAYSGALTEAGAKSLLSFRPRGGGGGGQIPEARNAKGNVKYWVKDGQITKYQFQVQGTVTFGDNDRDIDRTTTVEIKDIGTTKVEVPAEAKAKLS
jgi:hypothetical protein